MDRLKIVTNQYANKQVRWIKQRFLHPSRRQLPPVYTVNGDLTTPTEWYNNVTKICTDILEAHLQQNLNHPLILERKMVLSSDNDSDLLLRKCDTCDKVIVGSEQFKIHMKSSRHKKMTKIMKRKITVCSSNESEPPEKIVRPDENELVV